MTNDLSELEQQLIRGARRGLAPSREDRARALAAFEGAVAVCQSGTMRAVRPDGQPVSTGGAAWSTLPSVSAVAKRAGKALAVSSIIGVAFAGGYFTGLTRGGHASRTANPARIVPTAISPRADAPLPVETGMPQSVLRPEPSEPKPAGVHDSQQTKSAAHADVNPMELELELLRRADHALRENNPRVALGLLNELDDQVKLGTLIEERAAARVMAECMVEVSPASRRAAEVFLAAHPASVYAARIRSLCASTERMTESAPAGHE